MLEEDLSLIHPASPRLPPPSVARPSRGLLAGIPQEFVLDAIATRVFGVDQLPDEDLGPV